MRLDFPLYFGLRGASANGRRCRLGGRQGDHPAILSPLERASPIEIASESFVIADDSQRYNLYQYHYENNSIDTGIDNSINKGGEQPSPVYVTDGGTNTPVSLMYIINSNKLVLNIYIKSSNMCWRTSLCGDKIFLIWDLESEIWNLTLQRVS